MKLSTNLIFQIAALVAQYGNMGLGYTSGRVQSAIALTIGLAQALVAWKAHTVNVDGTPQSVGYIAK